VLRVEDAYLIRAAMVLLLKRHFSWGVVHLPMESYSQLISEGSHVRPIRRPLIVSEISYVGGSGFVGARYCCACFFSELLCLSFVFSWGVVRLPVETYLQLISEASHVQPI